MRSKIKPGKVAIVIFLTVLIWVSADLAKTEKVTVGNVRIRVGVGGSGQRWVSFLDAHESSVAIEEVVLKGSTSTVDKVKRQLRDGQRSLELFYNPQEEEKGKKQYVLDVFDFLRRSEQIRKLGLTVESCKPEQVKVNVVELAKKQLTVKCFDQSRIPLKAESIEPSKVEMFVPADWEGERLTAEVRLGAGEIQQARTREDGVTKKPYVELGPGQRREASEQVTIKLVSEAEQLKDYTITSATLGRCLSANLQGSYRVEVTNLEEVLRPIAIKATEAAKQAYELQPFQIILYVFDDDKKSTDEQRRKVVYNFPEDSVRKGEIILNQQPVIARFKLTPLARAEPGTTD